MLLSVAVHGANAEVASSTVNSTDKDGHTPLHLACIDGDIPCILYLLQVQYSHAFACDRYSRNTIIGVIVFFLAETISKNESFI